MLFRYFDMVVGVTYFGIQSAWYMKCNLALLRQVTSKYQHKLKEIQILLFLGWDTIISFYYILIPNWLAAWRRAHRELRGGGGCAS